MKAGDPCPTKDCQSTLRSAGTFPLEGAVECFGRSGLDAHTLDLDGHEVSLLVCDTCNLRRGVV